MKNRKNKIVLLGCFLITAIFFSGCGIKESNEISTQEQAAETSEAEHTEEAPEESMEWPEFELSEENYEAFLIGLACEGKETGEEAFLTTGMKDEDIAAILSGSGDCKNLYYQYYIENVSYETEETVLEQGSFISVSVELEFYDDCIPVSEMIRVKTKKDVYEGYLSHLETGFETLVFYADKALPEKDIIYMAEEAAWNCSDKMPLLYKSILHTCYYDEAGDYILILSLDYDSYGITESEQRKAQEEVQRELAMLAEEVRLCSDSKEEQCVRLYELITEWVDFDYALSDALMEVETSDDASIGKGRGIYGALIDGKSVCSGYACAYKEVCDLLGIPCMVMTGYAEDMDHAWNMVILDGEVAYFDPTWGDSKKWYDSYQFISEEMMETENRRTYDYLYVPEEFYEAGYVEKSAAPGLYDA